MATTKSRGNKSQSSKSTKKTGRAKPLVTKAGLSRGRTYGKGGKLCKCK